MGQGGGTARSGALLGRPKEDLSVLAGATVDLGFAKIDAKRFALLADHLVKNKTVKKLCLGWNEIGDIGAEKLSMALQQNTTLTELNLTENGIGEKGAERLAAALCHNSTLRVLDLMRNRIGDKGATCFASALSKNKTLQELKLFDTGIEYNGATRLMAAAEKNETLLALDIRWNDISDRRLVSRMEQTFAKNRGEAARTRDAPLAQRGDLELYIFTMRDKISSNGEYGPFICEEERGSLRTEFSAAEAWLQENRNATLEEYRSKLTELKTSGDVVAMRHQESLMRGQMVTAIKSTLANYRATVESNEGDKNGAIDPAKRKKILNACTELEQWLSDMCQAQEHLPDYERPALNCRDMVDKNMELANVVSDLLEDSHGGQADMLKEVAATSARGPASARGQAAGPSAAAAGSERKAQLLSYITQLQAKIAPTGECGAYVSDAERERLNAHLIGASIWASQTSGVPTVHYIEKLQELRSVGDVIEWRCDEDSMRNDWISAVHSTIANCRNAAEHPGDKYARVSPEKFKKIMAACQELEDWLKSMDKAQRDLAKHDRPVLLCADMERRNLDLARMVGELLEEGKSTEATKQPEAGPSAGYTNGGHEFNPPARDNFQGSDFALEDDDDDMPPAPLGAGKEGMPQMRGTGSTPRDTHWPGQPSLPKAPASLDAPAANTVGKLRDAGATAVTEDERLLELDMLDSACSLIVDEDDAPFAGRQLGH